MKNVNHATDLEVAEFLGITIAPDTVDSLQAQLEHERDSYSRLLEEFLKSMSDENFQKWLEPKWEDNTAIRYFEQLRSR